MLNNLETTGKERGHELQERDKLVWLIRHPSTDINTLRPIGSDDTSWDILEDRIRIDRREGHEMSTELADKVIAILRSRGVYQDFSYGIYSSPLPRAAILARYCLCKILEEHKNSPIPLPADSKVIRNKLFQEIPLQCTKQEFLTLEAQAHRKSHSVMEEWFDDDPGKTAAIFESQKERVLESIKLLASGRQYNLVFSHRLYIGFVLWLLKHPEKHTNAITAEDIVGIKDIARNIANTSISEILFCNGEGTVIKTGDISHLEDTNLIKGRF